MGTVSGEGHAGKGKGRCLIRGNRLKRVKGNWIREWMEVMTQRLKRWPTIMNHLEDLRLILK